MPFGKLPAACSPQVAFMLLWQHEHLHDDALPLSITRQQGRLNKLVQKELKVQSPLLPSNRQHLQGIIMQKRMLPVKHESRWRAAGSMQLAKRHCWQRRLACRAAIGSIAAAIVPV